MYNILVAFGFPPAFAGPVSSQFPEGVYFKADIVKVPN
jgi:hypothetical protein